MLRCVILYKIIGECCEPSFVEFALKLGLNPLPLTVDEAVRSVRKLIESGGKEKEEEANECD